MTVHRLVTKNVARIDKLRDASDGYRVAVEMYGLAIQHGCSPEMEAALWNICQREADAAQGKGT